MRKCHLTDLSRCPDGLRASKCTSCKRKMDVMLMWWDVFMISLIAICLTTFLIVLLWS